MHRRTAGFLLLLSAVGVFAPMLQALSSESPHACCLRRLHASGDSNPGVGSAAVRQGNCCPPVTTSRAAQLSQRFSSLHFQESRLQLNVGWRLHDPLKTSHPSVRAPPRLV